MCLQILYRHLYQPANLFLVGKIRDNVAVFLDARVKMQTVLRKIPVPRFGLFQIPFLTADNAKVYAIQCDIFRAEHFLGVAAPSGARISQMDALKSIVFPPSGIPFHKYALSLCNRFRIPVSTARSFSKTM